MKHNGKYYLYGLPYGILKDEWTENKLKHYKRHLPKKIRDEFRKFVKEECYSQESIGTRFFSFMRFKINKKRKKFTITSRWRDKKGKSKVRKRMK
jgi:hypothetical protein